MTTPDLSHDFRQCMRRLAASVSVISCAHEGNWFGMAATAVTSLSTEPCSMVVCLNASSSVIKPLMAAARFNVNVLKQSHVEVSSAFGGKLKGDARFGVGDWQRDESGFPYLADAQATLQCSVRQTVEFGTHIVVIAEVSEVRFADEVSPLIYQNGAYASALALSA
ncbi:MAG TPA: flavin reductase family protein [Paraburkholderia sp.]|nr:flavin reductase family protein [Paraburkholderia sp.]